MSESLRIALLLDPLSVVFDEALRPRLKWRNHAPQLAQELMGRGHTVRGFGAPPGLIPHTGEASLPGAENAWTKLQAFQPEVVVAYDGLSAAAVRGARAARKSGGTLVLVEAGLPEVGRRLERWRARFGELFWGRYVRRTADAVVALDPVARERALREGFADDLVTVVPHGVDVHHYRPGLITPIVGRHRIRGRILLYVGRLSEGRGVDLLVSVFAKTVGQRDDWSLVIAGDGPTRPRLRAKVERLGVASRVHWLPRPREEDLPGLMGASTLLAVPAREDVVMGRQISRSLACGLPVVASELPRLEGLFEDGQHGLFVEPGSEAAWTEAVQRAAGSPAARARWGQAAREQAVAHLAWDGIAQRFDDIVVEARAHARVRTSSRAEEQGDDPASEAA